MSTRLPGNLDGAGIGLMSAGDDFDERRFARAVFADQGVNFAGAQFEGDVLERVNAGEGFGNGCELEEAGTVKGLWIMEKGRRVKLRPSVEV